MRQKNELSDKGRKKCRLWGGRECEGSWAVASGAGPTPQALEMQGDPEGDCPQDFQLVAQGLEQRCTDVAGNLSGSLLH